MALSINGIGRTYYGQRDFEADGSFVATKWFIVAFFPISPSQSIRARALSSFGPLYQELEVIEELPVCWKQVFHTYAYAYGLLPFTVYLAEKFHWKSASQVIAMLAVAALPFVLRYFAKQRV